MSELKVGDSWVGYVVVHRDENSFEAVRGEGLPEHLPERLVWKRGQKYWNDIVRLGDTLLITYKGGLP